MAKNTNTKTSMKAAAEETTSRKKPNRFELKALVQQSQENRAQLQLKA